MPELWRLLFEPFVAYWFVWVLLCCEFDDGDFCNENYHNRPRFSICTLTFGCELVDEFELLLLLLFVLFINIGGQILELDCDSCLPGKLRWQGWCGLISEIGEVHLGQIREGELPSAE